MDKHTLQKLTAQASGLADSQIHILDEKKREIHAVLTPIGINQNGLELPLDEAKKAVDKYNKQLQKNAAIRMTADSIEKDSDLHSTAPKDIVGKIVRFEIGNENGRPNVEFVGKFYDKTAWAQQAFELVEDGIFGFDSYEIDYKKGECSLCHKEFSNPNEICNHLKTVSIGGGRKMAVGTSKAHIIVHGVTFKGASMLDRPGAGGKEARVKAVAHLVATSNKQEEEMDPKKKVEEQVQVEAANEELTDLEKLKAEIADLKAKLGDAEKASGELQKIVDGYQAKEREARVEAIIEAKKTGGKKYADEKAENAEKKALMAKSDEMLTEIEATVADLKPEEEEVKTPEDEKPEAQASKVGKETKPLTAHATTAPKDIPDGTDKTQTKAAMDKLFKAKKASILASKAEEGV